MLDELNPEVMCGISEAADTLGRHLGDLHDFAFLRDRLAGADAAPDGEKNVLLSSICAPESALARTALDLGCRFYAEKPGAFGRRLLRYARDWPSADQN